MLTAQRETAIAHPLLERVCDARRQSDALFDVVRTEAMYDRPIPERHRIVFYVGHLEAFDWNLLGGVLGLKSLHPEFDRLFAFGIDPVGGGLPADLPQDWPSLDKVREYVSGVRDAIDEKMSMAVLDPESYMRDGFPLETLLNVAIEHRLMHLETLAYMFHQLPLERKVPQHETPVLASHPLLPEMIQIPAGKITLGLSRQSGEFGWDNEFEKQTIDVPAFSMDRYMVSNGQFLEFMNAGGYDNRTYWTEDDWKWKSEQQISRPVFWREEAGAWLYRTMFDEIPLPMDWPAYVSHAEAAAYAKWAGKSLPTEPQWQRAAYGAPDVRERKYPWGSEKPHDRFGNFDFYHWDPAPVNAYPESRSAFGAEGMLGNGWEWTSSVFGPLPGFAAFPFYRGYSADFFDGKHFVIKGGSSRTAACMLRPTFRNWFQGHYQYVYAGFRCVHD